MVLEKEKLKGKNQKVLVYKFKVLDFLDCFQEKGCFDQVLVKEQFLGNK